MPTAETPSPPPPHHLNSLTMTSPFLQIPESYWVASNDLAFAIFDKYPVNDGHILVIPKRLTPTWFEATGEEQLAIMNLVEEAKTILDERYQPDGYNIGINVGAAAGQTVMHLHVHVIPRFEGDMDDPRGGVRHVIPWKGNYLTDDSDAPKALATGGDDPFLHHLRPLFAGASQVDVVAAFVQDSGLRLLRNSLLSAIDRGVAIRLLTGDYFQITQVEALQRLLDWTESTAARDDDGATGRLDVRVVEVGKDEGWPKSFHPKSWSFISDDGGVAYVGSSNISHMALTAGTEWNLRVRRRVDPQGFEEVQAAFESQWSRSTPLTADWIDEYELRVQAAPERPALGEAEYDAVDDVFEPHDIQRAALDALRRARLQGRRRALVVHATGLGKTWLAAFDVAAYRDYVHRSPRVLFLAHRAEILQQAAETFRRILPRARFGWFAGSQGTIEGDVVFASVQKLTLETHLHTIDPDAFDYIIVDEVHHAAAPSYRRILNHFKPGFVLGLTATPDRADEADVRSLFDDFIAHRADVGEGIEEGFLCPFEYFGIRDVVDFEPIPWRSGRFTTADLTTSLATEERMTRAWEAMEEHPGTRSIIFCCSIDHARFVRDWLSRKDLRAAAIFSAEDSDDRDASLTALQEGDLDAVCAVDILNEGVDIPAVDRVVMLRPTESPVVFMQQLGRGLRRADGKDHLTVLDFVGNHRVFLDRVRTLLSLGSSDTDAISLREFLVNGESPQLPPGCKVDIELTAIDMLKDLLPTSSRTALIREYRELREARGARPRAVEIYRLGLKHSTLRKNHGGWFGFLADEGDLDDAELQAWQTGSEWFREVETTALQKSYKMVVLQTLLDADALDTGLAIDQLAASSHELLARSPELFLDIAKLRELSDPREPDPETWTAYWDKWPLQIWAGDQARDIENPWFSRVDGHFASNIPFPSDADAREAFNAMTQELVELRFAQYRDRRSAASEGMGAFRAEVIIDGIDPVLQLPRRDDRPDIPDGELTVSLPSGQKWRLRLQKDKCTVGRPVGHQNNRLPDLLRTWFGPAAGETTHPSEVEFRPTRDGWQIEPLGAHVIDFPRPGRVIAFPSMTAAAGAHRADSEHPPRWQELAIRHGQTEDADFAIRVAGDSMNGGPSPVEDGSWVLLRWARGARLGEVVDRVALVRVASASNTDDPPAYHLKRIAQTDQGFELRSDNPATPSLPASEDTVIVALHVATLTDDDILSPQEATLIDALAEELRVLDHFDTYSAAFEATAQDLSTLLQTQTDLIEQLPTRDTSGLESSLNDFLTSSFGVSAGDAAAMSKRVSLRTVAREPTSVQ